MPTNHTDTETTRDKWLKAGYSDFAEFGPEKLSINRISKALGSSRASFYHHFGDTDMYIDDLLAHHWQICKQFNQKGKVECKALYPDLYNVLGMYTLPLKFSLQLFHHRHIPRFNILFTRSYALSANAFAVELFANHLGLDPSSSSVFDLWVAMGESWYSRLDPRDLSPDTLQKHSEEIIHAISDLINSKLLSSIHETH